MVFNSKIKASYLFFNSILMAFVLALILGVSTLDTVPPLHRFGMYVTAGLLLFFLVFHFYSIPKIKINNTEIIKYSRGKEISKILRSDFSKVEFLSYRHALTGKKGHALKSKNGSIDVPIHYYSNMREMLTILLAPDEMGRNTKIDYAFSPGSIKYAYKLFSSFTAVLMFFLSVSFLFLFFIKIGFANILKIHPLSVFPFIALISFIIGAFLKVTGYVVIKDDHLENHFPFLLMKRTIPIADLKKVQLEKIKARGESIKNIIAISNSYQIFNFGAQLNSKTELQEIQKVMK